MKHVVYFGAVTLLRQDIQIQSPGQGDSLVRSCRQSFSKSDLEIFNAFHKCADGISAHRAIARMWSKLPKTKTLLLWTKPRRPSLLVCVCLKKISLWTMRSHSASMLGIHGYPIPRKDSSSCGCDDWNIFLVYLLPVFANSNLHIFNLMWI